MQGKCKGVKGNRFRISKYISIFLLSVVFLASSGFSAKMVYAEENPLEFKEDIRLQIVDEGDLLKNWQEENTLSFIANMMKYHNTEVYISVSEGEGISLVDEFGLGSGDSYIAIEIRNAKDSENAIVELLVNGQATSFLKEEFVSELNAEAQEKLINSDIYGAVTTIADGVDDLIGSNDAKMMMCISAIAMVGFVAICFLVIKIKASRKIILLIAIVIMIPLSLYLGWKYAGRKYYITGVLIMFYAIVPFFVAFEKRKPQAKELVVLAVMCALASASRVVFKVVPGFSPLIGFVIITAIAFGPSSGFMCGAISAIVSNFYCGQGPWTPWQMFAFGMAGLVAGLIFQNKKVTITKISLTVIGFLLVQFITGPILDLCTIMATPFAEQISFEAYKISFLTGFVYNLIHSSSVAITLFFISKPMLEKLDRIKTKYGMIS